MSKEIGLGDLVEDCINGYKGVVFGIEPDGEKTYVHFKRTYSSWSGCDPRLGFPHRLNIKNVKVLRKADPMEELTPQLTADEKIDLLLEHLGLEFETIPSNVKVIKKRTPTSKTTKSNIRGVK